MSELERFIEEEGFPLVSYPKMGGDLAVDLYNEGDYLIAEMNLPGVDPKKIEVAVEDGYLRVIGSREDKKGTKKQDFYSREVRRGSFERIVHLPAHIDKDSVSAEYKHGVLKVNMPKQAETKAEKIKVEVTS